MAFMPVLKAIRFIPAVLDGGNVGFAGKYNNISKNKNTAQPHSAMNNKRYTHLY